MSGIGVNSQRKVNRNIFNPRLGWVNSRVQNRESRVMTTLPSPSPPIFGLFGGISQLLKF